MKPGGIRQNSVPDVGIGLFLPAEAVPLVVHRSSSGDEKYDDIATDE